MIRQRTKLMFTQQGNPQQNAYVERDNIKVSYAGLISKYFHWWSPNVSSV